MLVYIYICIDKKNYCFYIHRKETYLPDELEKSYDINYSLEQLEKIVDPQFFFRVNRHSIVNINAIKDIIVYSGRRFKLKASGSNDGEILVNSDRIAEFSDWLER